MRLNLRRMLAVVVLGLGLSPALAVPPCPGKTVDREPRFPHRDRASAPETRQRPVPPENILVLAVDFPDLGFDLTADYPDSLAHDRAYLERCLFHLREYMADNSRGQYNPVFTLSDPLTLSHGFAYYGDDAHIENSIEMVRETIELADPLYDFSLYNGFVILHAGPGEESDIHDQHLDQLWSTFVNRFDMQNVFDPENDDYPGISTGDGVYITQVAIFPESEWQPDFTSEDPILGLLGVMVHEFGHVMGLPTLYDNITSDNSYSQGIGNFDPMGTGAWNALGYVPPMLCAWSRTFLGWETPQEITAAATGIELDHIRSASGTNPRVVKLPVSEGEYFLLENRQQNPDASEETWYRLVDGQPVVDKTQASFTFDTLAVGQKHYTWPNNHIPKFDFMHNSYRNCEWDFYLPGYGGPTSTLRDGSGLYVWHIDENVIAAKFTADFYLNSVNSDPTHKGVDLEEADGVQDMDSAYPSVNRYGSPDDSYRSGNNDYLGFPTNPTTGLTSLPDASSYYGGTPLEIYGIGPSASTMSLSVRFRWSLNTGYPDINTIPMIQADFDGDGTSELLYTMPDGELYWWRNGVPLTEDDGYPAFIPASGRVVALPAYDTRNATLYLPCASSDQRISWATLHWPAQWNVTTQTGCSWAANPVANPDPDAPLRAFMPLNTVSGCALLAQRDNGETSGVFSLTGGRIMTNLVLTDDALHFVVADSANVRLWGASAAQDYSSGTVAILYGLTPADTLVALVAADFDPDRTGTEFAIVTRDGRLHLYYSDGYTMPGFPVDLPTGTPSLPTVADIDHNGRLDVIVGGENGFTAVGYNGEILNAPVSLVDEPDSLGISAGVLVVDLDDDGNFDLSGALSRNRTGVWNDRFAAWPGFPVAFTTRSRFMPVPVIDEFGDSYLYQAGDYGRIERFPVPDAVEEDFLAAPWKTELGDPERTACYRGPDPVNTYTASGVFVPNEVYVFPNPVDEANPSSPTLNLMVSRNTTVDVKIFDIAGNLIHKDKLSCEAWMKNRSPLGIDLRRISSGMYFIVLRAGNDQKTLRFAVEK